MIPLIFGAIALGTAAYGAISGINGASDMLDAKDIIEEAKESYQEAYDIYASRRKEVESQEENFKQFKIDIITGFIYNYSAIQTKYVGLHSKEDAQLLELMNSGIGEKIRKYNLGEISDEECFQDIQFTFKAIKQIGEVVQSGANKGILAVGATKLATTVGVASTGTAISGLSGAAAHSAALAWLGGGSLAAGGGGMALGGMILTGLTAGPALAILGFTLASKGEKDLNCAREYQLQTQEEIEKLNEHINILNQISNDIISLRTNIKNLAASICIDLNNIEGEFNNYLNCEKIAIDLNEVEEKITRLLQLINKEIVVA